MMYFRTDIASMSAVLLALVLSGAVACESESRSAESGAAVKKIEQKELRTTSWPDPEVESLVEPPKSARRSLELSDPQKFPRCHELFEPDGELVDRFLPDRERPEFAVAGCDPEAYRKLDGGRRLVAYRVADRARRGVDLRLVAFDEGGDRAWTHRMDRSAHAGNFSADFRSSFIAPLLPQLVCVGTLWEGGTQGACIDPQNEKVEWSGELDFWSGIELQGVETSLVGADISGLTRRYPYSGVEMRRVDFAHLGGHSALYATDGRRFFFVPKAEKPQRLTAYELASLQPIWRVKLPKRPDAGYNEYAFADHDVAVLKIGPDIYGFDAASGEVRWAFEVGEDRPPIAAGPELLYMLVMRSNAASLLAAVEPTSGSLEWYGRVPTGTLSVQWTSGMLLIRSVRAFQRVQNAG